MGRLTQVNQFNDGMNKDLHPLMTPNTILTDCLNGTLITYNGDEFVLQNDMGNYAMQYGVLGNYYVPVGMKEHGGFLYIVSYNPIDNKVQIGTFPSQKTIFTPSDNEADSDSLEQINLGEGIYHKYSSINPQPLTIYSKDQNLYLNPGDKYLLGTSDQGLLINSWQHLTTYVLTNDNKLYDISSVVDIKFKTDVTNIEKFIPINWEIPGWLCSKFEINTPEEFIVCFDSYELNVTKEEGKNNYTVTPSGSLKLKTVWNNSVYKEIIEQELKNGKLVYFFSKESIAKSSNDDISGNVGEEEKNANIVIKSLSGEILNYNNLQTLIYCTVDSNEFNVNKYSYVCPALVTDDGKYVILDQFETNITAESYEIDTNNISIGDDYFKYYTDQNSFTLYFNYKSYPGTTIEYSISRYRDPRYNSGDSDYKKVRFDGSSSVTLTDLNYNGNNIIDIPFSSQLGSNSFDKEDLYIINLDVWFNETKLKSFEYPLYVSEITNYFFDIYDSFVNVDDFAVQWSNKIADIISIGIKQSPDTASREPFIKIKPVGKTEYALVPDVEKPQEEIKNNLRKYFGDPFVDIESSELPTGISSYRVGQNIVLKKSNEDSVYLNLPYAQDGQTVGRLWRYTDLDSISKEQCFVIDSLGKSHKLEITNEQSDTDDTEYIKLRGASITLPIYDEYNITVGSTTLPKQEPDRWKTLCDYDANTIFKGNTETIGPGIVPLSTADVQFNPDSGIICIRSYIHVCVVNRNSFYLEIYGSNMHDDNRDMYATFDKDNNLYISDKDQIKAIRFSIDNNTGLNNYEEFKISYDSIDGYNDNIKYFPNNEQWNERRVQLENHGMSGGDGWVKNIHKIVTDGSHYPQIVMMERRDQSKNPFKIGHWGTVNINATWYCGIFIPTTTSARPIMLFPMGLVDGGNEDTTGRSKKSFEASVVAWCAMMYYLRYAETVKTIVYNYTNLSLTTNAFKEFTLKSINLNGKLSWKYWESSKVVPEENNSKIDSIIKTIEDEIKGEPGIINYRIPASTKVYFEDDTNTNIFLQEIIEEVNSKADQLYQIKKEQEEVYANSFYLIPEYNSNNNIVNLTGLRDTLRIAKDTVVLPNDSQYYSGTTAIAFRAATDKWAEIANTYVESIM